MQRTKLFFLINLLVVFVLFFVTPIKAQIPKDTLKAFEYYKKADSLVTIKNYENSTLYFKKALLQYKRAKTWERVVNCYNKISDCYLKNSSFENALYHTKKALHIAETKLPNSYEQVANVIENMGLYFFKTSDYQNALNQFKAELEMRLKATPRNNINIASAYNNLGKTYARLAKYNLAINHYEKAIKKLVNSNENVNDKIAMYYNNIASSNIKNGNYDQGLNNLYQALEFQAKFSNEVNHNSVHYYNNIGIANFYKGNFEKGNFSFQKALKIQIKTEGRLKGLTASIYNNLGIGFKKIGKLEKSILHQKEALSIRSKVFSGNHSSIAMSYFNLGNVLSEKEEHIKALSYYKKALHIYSEVFGKKHINVGRCLDNIGTTYQNLGKIEEALEHLNQSIEIWKNTFGKKHHKISNAYFNIATCYIDKKDLQTAKQYLQKSIEIELNTLGKNSMDLVIVYNTLADIFLKQKNFKKAIKYNEMALSTNVKGKEKVNLSHFDYGQYSDPLVTLSILNTRIKIYNERNKHKPTIQSLQKNLQNCKKADNIAQKIRNTLTNYQDKLTFSKTTKEIYTQAVEASFLLYEQEKDSSALHQAFYYAEKSKANTLQELLNDGNAKQFAGIPDPILALEKELKTDVAFYTSKITQELAQKNIDSVKIDRYENKLFTLHSKQDSLQDVLVTQYPKYYQLKYQDSIITIPQLQDKLHKNTTILEFFTTDSITYAFTVSKNSYTITKLTTPKLEEQIQQFKTSILSKDIIEYKKLGVGLYNNLIAPIEKEIAGDELIIIPDGALWHLNFDILHTQNTLSKDPKKFKYFLQNYAISYANSANVLFNIPKQHSSSQKLQECLAFSYADSNYSQNKNNMSLATLRNAKVDLPGSREEIKTISQIVDGQYYYGVEANEANFKKHANQYNILHLALHGDIDDTTPENSKLYFTKNKDTIEDNVLYNHELFAMDIPAELVVLSACNTGSGIVAKGEGIMSIGNAFQYAGSKSLLLSGWELSDQTTPELMKLFYKNLKKGLPKSKALQQAKLQYLNTSDIHRSHPFFWGGLYLVGNSDPIDLKSSTPLYWVLALLLILSIGLFFYKRKFAKR